MPPFFETIEGLYNDLERWKADPVVKKEDVIRSTRSCLTVIVQSLLAASYVGSAFAHPSDNLVVNHASSNIPQNRIVFQSDAVDTKKVIER